MNGASASMAREELQEASLRIESLTAQLAGLQKEVGFWSFHGFNLQPNEVFLSAARAEHLTLPGSMLSHRSLKETALN